VIQPYVVGLHLGPAFAPSAIVLVRRTAGATERDPVTHCVAAARRWPAGTRYEVMMPLVTRVLGRAGWREGVVAVVANVTGVPAAAVGLVDRIAGPVRFEATRVTTGDHAEEKADGWRVPQRDLVGVLQLLLGQQRLKLPDTLPETPALMAQIHAFGVVAPGRPSSDRYATAPGSHDGLVTALALACWFGECINAAQIEEGPSEFSAWSQDALLFEHGKRRIGRKPAPRGGPSEGSQMLDGLS